MDRMSPPASPDMAPREMPEAGSATASSRPAETEESGRRRESSSSLALFLSPLFELYQGTLTTKSVYPAMRAFLLSDGYAAAWGKLVAAVLVNHVRRIAVPWLGQQPLFSSSLELMKMAKSSPYFVLEEMLRVPIGRVGVWAVTMMAYASIRQGLMSFFLSYEIMVVRRDAMKRILKEKMVSDVLMVVLLSMAVMHAEYVYGEAAWAAALLVSVVKVAVYGAPESLRMLWNLVTESVGSMSRLLLVSVLFQNNVSRGLSLLAPRGGRLPLAVYLFGAGVGYVTYNVVRYSNYYFIALEMREMLLTWLWLAVATATAVYWKYMGTTPELDEAISKLE
ncbi:hypothetical protein VHEMI00855 [[Torrubiella] hemipterigena]|uniref:Uncharacterized protein n=1 Tax=[Torrubiella] hemipterigena TaxID=1531966 RepID=A0A0A1SKG2_9HYPO|nr:hypothetical protein VHEMI00855 [[Torrubiella] hemipterigena]